MTKRVISRNQSSDEKIIHFGKYKGQPMTNILEAEDSYLRWLLKDTEEDFGVDVKEYLKSKGVILGD